MKRVQGIKIPQTLDEICDPQRMALVIYDMQIGILTQINDTANIVARVSRLLEAAQRAIEALRFARGAVFTNVEAFCQAVKRKGG